MLLAPEKEDRAALLMKHFGSVTCSTSIETARFARVAFAHRGDSLRSIGGLYRYIEYRWPDYHANAEARNNPRI